MITDTGKGNIIKGVVPDTLNLRFLGNNNKVIIYQNSKISGGIVFFGNGGLFSIADESEIKAFNCAFEDNDSSFVIGSGVCIYEGLQAGVLEGKRISIGDGCLLSRNMRIRTGDSHRILDLQTGSRLNPGKDIELGKHVWCGESVVILKGAKIGDGCTVGMNSVVTKQFPSNCTIAGNPARVIRAGTKWEQ